MDVPLVSLVFFLENMGHHARSLSLKIVAKIWVSNITD